MIILAAIVIYLIIVVLICGFFHVANGGDKMKVYIVFYSDGLGEAEIEKVFSSMAAARRYVERKKGDRWIDAREVE